MQNLINVTGNFPNPKQFGCRTTWKPIEVTVTELHEVPQAQPKQKVLLFWLGINLYESVYSRDYTLWKKSRNLVRWTVCSSPRRWISVRWDKLECTNEWVERPNVHYLAGPKAASKIPGCFSQPSGWSEEHADSHYWWCRDSWKGKMHCY